MQSCANGATKAIVFFCEKSSLEAHSHSSTRLKTRDLDALVGEN